MQLAVKNSLKYDIIDFYSYFNYEILGQLRPRYCVDDGIRLE